MPKRKNINGLPNNLVQQYFSNIFYIGNGYMADWIWKAATERNVTYLEIDILNRTVSPKSVEIASIISQLGYLELTIHRVLSQNTLPSNFITAATFEVHIPDGAKPRIDCVAVLEDMEGRIYRGKTYVELAKEIKASL